MAEYDRLMNVNVKGVFSIMIRIRPILSVHERSGELSAIRVAQGTNQKQVSLERLPGAVACASDGSRSGTVRPPSRVPVSQATLPPGAGSSAKSRPRAEGVTTSATCGMAHHVSIG